MINPPGGECTNCLLENSGNKHSKNDADFLAHLRLTVFFIKATLPCVQLVLVCCSSQAFIWFDENSINRNNICSTFSCRNCKRTIRQPHQEKCKILTFQFRVRGHSLNSYPKSLFWFYLQALPVRLVTSRTRFRVDITREDHRCENSIHSRGNH